MSIKIITVDLYKDSISIPAITTRVGDNGQQITVRILENGQVVSDTVDVELVGITSKDKFIRLSGTKTTGTGLSTITITKDWNSSSGYFKMAYIKTTTNNNVVTTTDINWNVLSQATVTSNDTAHYVDELQKVIDQLQADADATLIAINTKLAKAQQDILDLNTSIDVSYQKLNQQLASDSKTLNDRLTATNAKIDELNALLATIETSVNNTKDESINAINASKADALKAVDDALIKLQQADYYSKADSDKRYAPLSVQTTVTNHINNKANPHGVTAKQTGAIPVSSTLQTDVSTPVNFTTAPTVNGLPIGSDWKGATWKQYPVTYADGGKSDTSNPISVWASHDLIKGKMFVMAMGAVGRNGNFNSGYSNIIMKLHPQLAADSTLLFTGASDMIGSAVCETRLAVLNDGGVQVKVRGASTTYVGLNGVFFVCEQKSDFDPAHNYLAD